MLRLTRRGGRTTERRRLRPFGRRLVPLGDALAALLDRLPALRRGLVEGAADQIAERPALVAAASLRLALRATALALVRLGVVRRERVAEGDLLGTALAHRRASAEIR